LKKKQKATQGIATTSFPGVTAANAATGTGLVQPTTALVAGDRGCFPGVGLAAQAQAAGAQLILRAGPAATGPEVFATDYIQAYVLLCLTSGTCCRTDLCNTMSRIEMSFVSIVISMALALIGVFSGF
jgi:hypothetical protein